MLPYRKLDAWKSSNALTLAIYQLTKDEGGRDPQLVRRLRHLALRTTGKIAFGSGTHNYKMFRAAVARSSGYLAEFGYYLSLARVMAVLPEKVCDQVDALRGRAAFYTFQLLNSLLAPRDPKKRDR